MFSSIYSLSRSRRSPPSRRFGGGHHPHVPSPTINASRTQTLESGVNKWVSERALSGLVFILKAAPWGAGGEGLLVHTDPDEAA